MSWLRLTQMATSTPIPISVSGFSTILPVQLISMCLGLLFVMLFGSKTFHRNPFCYRPLRCWLVHPAPLLKYS